MLKDFLDLHKIKSKASFVAYGYGQVEPNHLSAQRTGQIYAQLPAKKDIEILEQGQFVKYDYAKGMVDFDGAGEWMLVYNETKLYREHQNDCEFALRADDYQARIYSPFGYGLDKNGVPMSDEQFDRQARYLNGKDAEGKTSTTVSQFIKVPSGSTSVEIGGRVYTVTGGNVQYNSITYDVVAGADIPVVFAYDDVTAGNDPYELHYNEDPMHIVGPYKEQRMAENVNSMVPRVFKTNVGDIYTTNTINATAETAVVGALLTPGTDGILKITADGAEDMVWQIVKVYTMPDHQPAVKLMRIK